MIFSIIDWIGLSDHIIVGLVIDIDCQISHRLDWIGLDWIGLDWIGNPALHLPIIVGRFFKA